MPIGELVVGTVLKKLISEVANQIKDYKKKDIELINISGSIDGVLEKHIKKTYEWAEEINLRRLLKSKKLKDNFVNLDLNLVISSQREKKEEDRTMKASDISLWNKNILILGNPGAGKTTTIKKNILERTNSNSSIPILYKFRDLKEDDNLPSALIRIFGLILKINFQIDEIEKKTIIIDFLYEIINSNNIILFLDGLDELQSSLYKETIHDLNYLLNNTLKGKVIITSRTGGYIPLEKIERVEIAPLNSEQINEFCTKWLGKEEGKNLQKKIIDAPYRGTEVRPLTLAQFCALYERTKDIPERPIDLYGDLVRLLLREWDMDRLVKHESYIENFNPNTIERFLILISYSLGMKRYKGDFKLTEYLSVLDEVMPSFSFGINNPEEILSEVEKHTGLILENGYHSYKYYHLTIQEYFIASYLSKKPTIHINEVELLQDEFAIATALSSEPNDKFVQFITRFIKSELIVRSNIVRYLFRVTIEKPIFKKEIRFGFYLYIMIMSMRNLAEQNKKIIYLFFENEEVRQSLMLIKKYLSIDRNLDNSLMINIDYKQVTRLDHRFFDDDIEILNFESMYLDDEKVEIISSLLNFDIDQYYKSED